MKTLAALTLAFAVMATTAPAVERKIEVVAAENFYGGVAQEIGGDRVVGHQHPEQSRPGPAPVRGLAGDHPPDRRGADRGL